MQEDFVVCVWGVNLRGSPKKTLFTGLDEIISELKG